MARAPQGCQQGLISAKCCLSGEHCSTTSTLIAKKPSPLCVKTAYDHCWAHAHCPEAMQVSGSRDTTIKLWNRDNAQAVATYSAHALPVTGLAALEGQAQICSGSRDCTLRLWDIDSSSEVSCASIPQNVVTFMKAVPGEAAVLQAGEDLHLRLWDTRTLQPASLLPQHSNIPLSCDVSSDGKLVSRSGRITYCKWPVALIAWYACILSCRLHLCRIVLCNKLQWL